jgi:hypothetical protein
MRSGTPISANPDLDPGPRSRLGGAGLTRAGRVRKRGIEIPLFRTHAICGG